MKHSVHVITHFVSPYQVELFNAVAAQQSIDLSVAYLHDSWKGRHWEQIEVAHSHCILNNRAAQQTVRERVENCDLVVFNLYRDSFVRRMMRIRARQQGPWVFWGERPAFRVKGRLGLLYRRWRLAPLLRSTAPIWGIGSWATAKYRDEFGPHRKYADLPYYSDLSRFRPTDELRLPNRPPHRFLYSGALTARKGVDLLASAFCELLSEHQESQLTIVGVGELEGELRSRLAGVNKSVHFAGFQDWQVLPNWYHAADILIAPSRYDGWGLIVAEGLAAALPVIASDQMGAARDLIQHGRNGWIFPAGSAESLASCWREAASLSCSDFQERRSLAAKSVENHQLSDGAARFAQLSQQAILEWRNAEGAAGAARAS